ncbi:MAG: translation elongation factor Ts [Paracoccaceae bacterium]
MTITAKMVKDLRDITGVGMMDAKKALIETNGDFDSATDWLRQKGLAKAQKKSGRIAAEGLIGIKVGNNTTTLLEANCETDFVARNEEFQDMINNILNNSLGKKTLNEILNSSINGRTVDEILIEKVTSIGEKISLRRMYIISGKYVGFYIHNSVSENLGKIGVVVSLSEDNETLAKQIAMHIAASNPLALSEEHLSEELLKKEENLYFEQARETGKPKNIIDNMVKGKLKKFVSEVTLLNQNFVIDPDFTINEILKNNNNSILNYVRFEVGEGIEKNTEDFAEEVMKSISG